VEEIQAPWRWDLIDKMSNYTLGDTRFNALIVDDEPAILTILTQVLEDQSQSSGRLTH